MRLQLIFFTILAISAFASSEGISKSKEFRKLVENDANAMPMLNSTGYKYFIEESPRPYDVVIFFTAENCGFCDEIENELKQVSILYRQNGGIYPQVKDGKTQKATYFIKMVYSLDAKDVFSKFNFKSIPNLFISTPQSLRVSEIEKIQYIQKNLWQITGTDGHVTSSKLLEHVNKRLNKNAIIQKIFIEYKEPIVNFLILMGFLLIIGSILLKIFLKLKKYLINSKLWLVGSLIIYFICMAGVVYNIIHGIPFTNIDRNGNFEWYHSGSRSQFGMEGFLMSGSIVLSGLLIMCFQLLPRFGNLGFSSTLLYIILTGMTYVILRFIEDIYHRKSGFYNPNFWPPAHYIKGPLMRDQGNNI